LKIVLVKWEDSASASGWTDEDDLAPAECETVGYLLKKNKDRVVVVQSTSDIAHYDNRFAIPRGCIKSIKELDIK